MISIFSVSDIFNPGVYVIYITFPLILVVPECMAYNRGPEPVIQETPVPSTPPPPTLPPCRPKGGATVSDIKRHMMMTHNKVKVTGNDVIGRTYNWKTEVNCTGEKAWIYSIIV